MMLWAHGNNFTVGVEGVLQLPNSPAETLRTTLVNSSLLKCTFPHHARFHLENRKGVGISLTQRGEHVSKSALMLAHEQQSSMEGSKPPAESTQLEAAPAQSTEETVRRRKDATPSTGAYLFSMLPALVPGGWLGRGYTQE